MELYRSDTTEKLNYVKKDIGKKEWDRLPRKVKGALVDLDYRGDYRGSTNFKRLFKEGKYIEAATELEVHEEARQNKGIAKRIARNADVIRSFGINLKDYNEQLKQEGPKEPFSEFLNEVHRQLGSK